MDLALDSLDGLCLDALYQKLSPQWLGADRHDPLRQSLSIYLVVAIGGAFFYFFFAGIIWSFFFDRAYLKHPKILPNQVQREIMTTVSSIPFMTLLTTPIFLAEVRGYSQLVETWGPWHYELLNMLAFLTFTDFCIYWIHRFLHHPFVYPTLHKTHHLWKVPTPWASHAFHPVDGFLQSTPYHLYAFLIPMNKTMYMLMFIFVNCWTISIHDGIYVSKEGVVNSSAHHAEHHLKFSCNYGQYFTFWDRLFGTHIYPDHAGLDPVAAAASSAKTGRSSAAANKEKAG